MVDVTKVETTQLMQNLAKEVMNELKLKDKEIKDLNTALEDHKVAKYKTIVATYYGEPKAQSRVRISGNLSHFYDPDKSFKLTIGEAIRHELGRDFKPITTEVHITARYYRAYPKSTSRKNRVLMELGVIRPLRKPDLDNYEKLLYDALLNVLYTDDCIVVSGKHEKFYSVKPRVEIEVTFKEN